MVDAAPIVEHVVAASTPSEPAPEVVANAAVEIAGIAADRDVAIAEIQAETRAKMSDAVDELEDDVDELEDDVEWLRSELAALRAACEANQAEGTSLRLMVQEMASQWADMQAMMLSLIPPSPSEQENPNPLPPDVADGLRENPAPESPPSSAGMGRRRRVLL
jgi:outer membrane murein-binding lipoprotein Lpp